MNRFSTILLLLVVALLALGLKQLFDLRFETGDIYPNYSSLRTDPLGTKALFESYAKLMPAQRNYGPLSRLKESKDVTLFFLGLEPSDLTANEQELAHLEAFVKSGGRLVLGLEASKARGNSARPTAGGRQGNQPPKILLTDRWGFALDYLPKQDSERATLAVADARLPQTIPFRSAVRFKNLDSGWKVVYESRTNQSVLVERQLGLGTLVLFADSYLFSNEALLDERHPALLAWFAGDQSKIVFDETHLGVRENHGIATLARKYRLHGVGVAVLLLAALFIWKNAAPFLPPHPAEVERASVLQGKDSASGFFNLLRRNIPSDQLLETCINEWQKSCAHTTPKHKLRQMQQLVDEEFTREPNQRQPVKFYEALRQILLRSRKPQPGNTPAAEPGELKS